MALFTYCPYSALNFTCTVISFFLMVCIFSPQVYACILNQQSVLSKITGNWSLESPFPFLLIIKPSHYDFKFFRPCIEHPSSYITQLPFFLVKSGKGLLLKASVSGRSCMTAKLSPRRLIWMVLLDTRSCFCLIFWFLWAFTFYFTNLAMECDTLPFPLKFSVDSSDTSVSDLKRVWPR